MKLYRIASLLFGFHQHLATSIYLNSNEKFEQESEPEPAEITSNSPNDYFIDLPIATRY